MKKGIVIICIISLMLVIGTIGCFEEKKDDNKDDDKPKNKKPVLENITYTPKGINASQLPANITFSVNASDPNEDDTLSYNWTIENETTELANGTDKTIKYEFNQTGNFTIKVTVEDQKGLSANKELTIEIKDE